MKDPAETKKIAVLIDADNAQHTKLHYILQELTAHGPIVVKRAYGDWSLEGMKNWPKTLNELAVEPVQQFSYTVGKNATDIKMIIDAMDLLYTEKFDAFALVSSDSDFTRLASRLKEDGIYVFGFGEKKTPQAFKNACDDFIITENLGEAPAATSGEADTSGEELDEIFLLLNDAWQKYKSEDDWANLAPVGNYIKRRKPDFDPRTFGAPKLADLIQQYPDHFTFQQTGERETTVKWYQPK